MQQTNGPTPRAEWLGRRVSVRRVLEREPSGKLCFGDVVGDLIGLDAQSAVVDTRDGSVEIPLALIAAARQAPPSTADELALEAVMARGLRPAEIEQLGGWLLRAGHGLTRRANSVLPLRSPGMPLADALARAHEWYADRNLPLVIAVPSEARRLLDAELGELGWVAEAFTHVLACRLDRLELPPDDGSVALAGTPSDAWLARFRDGTGGDDTRALLTRHDAVRFASVVVHGETIAIGRGVVDDGWLGVTGVEVAPQARRRGLARQILTALAAWATSEGAWRSYLQVFADNATALRLYESAGYWRHHDYHYRHEPPPGTARP